MARDYTTTKSVASESKPSEGCNARDRTAKIPDPSGFCRFRTLFLSSLTSDREGRMKL